MMKLFCRTYLHCNPSEKLLEQLERKAIMASRGHGIWTLLNLALVLLTIELQSYGHGVDSYELKLDKEQDRVMWKFKGHYLYTQSSADLEDLLNTGTFPSRHRTSGANGTTPTNLQLPQNGLFDNSSNVRNGIWFTKNLPNRQNTLVLTYTLKHALFTQGWVSFYATPKVEVKIKTNRDEEVARFWNDGQNWCDAVVSMGLKTTFTLEVSTPEPRDYFLLDKIIMGIFSNVSQLNGRKLAPCLTSPLNTTSGFSSNSPVTSGQTRNENTNALEQTSGPKPAFLKQTLSRQSVNFSDSNESNPPNKTGDTDEHSSAMVGKAESSTKGIDIKAGNDSQSSSSPNRQSRSSDSDFNQSTSTSSASSIGSQIIDASSNPTSKIDLNVAIPLTSSILQQIRTHNSTVSHSQSLQCSCSCSSPM